MFHFFLPQSMWDLSLTIRDQNLSRCIEGKTLTTDVPIPVFLENPMDRGAWQPTVHKVT